MKIKLNRRKMGLAALLVAAGAGWLVYSRMQADANAKSQVAARSAADQELVDTIMTAPEQFDAAVESSEQADPKAELPEQSGASVLAAAGDESSSDAEGALHSVSTISRPNMLSAVEKPALNRSQEEPVAAETLYFYEDYSSMRNDAVRDPDSPENRAGVVALMKARQKRLSQNQ